MIGPVWCVAPNNNVYIKDSVLHACMLTYTSLDLQLSIHNLMHGIQSNLLSEYLVRYIQQIYTYFLSEILAISTG